MPRKDGRLCVSVVGDGSVGKSSIINRFVSGGFKTKYDPTIEDSFLSQVTVRGVVVPIVIVDTSGQEEFTPLVDICIRNSDCCMVVFDLCSKESFKSVPGHVRKVVSACKDLQTFPLVLVGNKSDRDQVVADESVKQLADQLQVQYYKTSARENENITVVFEYLIGRAQRHQEPVAHHHQCCTVL